MANDKSSTPSLTRFNPHDVPWQVKPIEDVRTRFDYRLGSHELLFSGSVGSAKSILGAHLGVTHCLMYPRAKLCLGRKSLKDIRETIFLKILEHLEGDLKEGVDYFVNWTQAEITFRNRSEIISRSWHDRNYKKFRSLELSAALVEELTENNEDEKEAIDELSMRVGRLPHVPESWICYMTNPDDPEHWVHREFVEKAQTNPTRHVYYSVTSDNKFLPASYIDRLKRNLDPKTAQRMIYGQWVALDSEGIYHAYKKEKHFKNKPYQIETAYPIRMSFDFNIGEGKPFSLTFFQWKYEHFHFFEEVVLDTARTLDALEEAASRGLFDHNAFYIVHGDATGKARDTRSRRSDYEIIKDFLANYKTRDGRSIKFDVQVPNSNPPIRSRHNFVNGHLENCNGESRVTLYEKCSWLDKGLRLTKLKKGGSYTEDDSASCPWQHITTAMGYGMMATVKYHTENRSRSLAR